MPEEIKKVEKPTADAVGLSELLGCPCGNIPKVLIIESGVSCKHAWVNGDCCNEWSVEFRTDYQNIDTDLCMERAKQAWNNAQRAT